MKRRSLGIALTALAAAFIASKTESGSNSMAKGNLAQRLPVLVSKRGFYGVTQGGVDMRVVEDLRTEDSKLEVRYHPNTSSEPFLHIIITTGGRRVIYVDRKANFILNYVIENEERRNPTPSDRSQFLFYCYQAASMLDRN